LLPNPPPVYSLISTTSSGLMFIQRAIAGTVCLVLCVPVCINNLPFCQYAIAVRGSRHSWLTSGVTNVSSRINAALRNPASTSP